MTTTLRPPSHAAREQASATPSRTTLPATAAEATPETATQERRDLSPTRLTDVLALVGASVAAVCLTWLLTALTPISGRLAPVVLAYVFFLVLYAILVSFDESGPVVRDRVTAAWIHSLAFTLLAVLFLVVGYVIVRGFKAMSHWNFFTQDLASTGPLDPLTKGGIIHAVIGTLQQITLALIITIPLGIVCAVFMTEFPGRFARFIRTIVEAMTALPSIVAGLFIYATFILALGNEKSGLAASLALSVMMLPIIIRASDVVLRLVPGNLKEASYALGSSHWRTVWNVVLPMSRSGLTTAVILGTARGIGETSPVLLTAGFNTVKNSNPVEGPQVSLPLAAFTMVQSPSPEMIARGFGTAATLMALVLVLFVIARFIGGRGPGHVSHRQRRRMARASRRDVQRFAARSAAVVATIALIAVAASAFSADKAMAATAHKDSYVPISGTGSTWSQNALDQWRRNVNQYGMQVNYQGISSTEGRNQFANGTVDFGVSEIPYGLRDNGVYDSPPERGYAYMPIVAGGTAFMYNLKIGGKRVANLRLSGENLARIFTGVAKTWNDPKIQKDNPALALPARRIVPVVRAESSGTTAQLTRWMSSTQPSLWNAYCKKAGRSTPCGFTSSYPVVSGSGFTAQTGSLGVSGYVAQEQNEGTITYVEYSYALNTNFPVVKVLNKSNYYVEPTAKNVAVGLLGARINNDRNSDDYLTQILDGVYANKDKRAYPLSSYSYMILPTEVAGSFNTDKGKTLGAFSYYFLCEGQQQAESLGYSPLPINLVKAGLAQVKKIPGVDVKNVDIKKCKNPTFSADGSNTLARTAPYPPACDHAGATQCTTGTGGALIVTANTGGAPNSEGDGGGGDGGGGGGSSGTGGSGTGSDGSAGAGPGGGSDPVIDPDTGEVIDSGDSSADATVSSTPLELQSSFTDNTKAALMVLAAGVLLMVVLLPPIIGVALARRRNR